MEIKNSALEIPIAFVLVVKTFHKFKKNYISSILKLMVNLSYKEASKNTSFNID